MDFKLDPETQKWDGRSHPILNRSAVLLRLEVELHGEFKHAIAFLGSGLSKVRIVQSDRLRSRILLERQIQIAGSVERRQRMIQEVVGLNPELQSLRLRNLEVLE